MAILLTEAGLYERSRIYATDMNAVVVEKAKAGSVAPFSSWYTSRYERASSKAELKRNVVFAPHNLAADRSFNAFNVILCRNVMIYFSRTLQAAVQTLFYESLEHFGFLLLGPGESLPAGGSGALYEVVDEPKGMFRRRR